MSKNSQTRRNTRRRRRLSDMQRRTKGRDFDYSTPMARGCLPYPSRDARISEEKEAANRRVMDVFGTQGLSLERGTANVVILDTPDLRTTTLLMRRFRRNIRQIVIVEQHRDVSEQIKAAVQRAELGRIVSVVNDEVVQFLLRGWVSAQYIWLDCMTTDPDRYSELAPVLAAANTRALAITLSKRVPGGYAKRAAKIMLRYREALPYRVLDWGYRISSGTQPMQILALGVVERPCSLRPRSTNPVPGSPGLTEVSWYGYPDVTTIESGSPDTW